MTGSCDLTCPICKKAVREHNTIEAAMHAFDMRRTGIVTDEQFRNAIANVGRTP